jgi:hypothetical protein
VLVSRKAAAWLITSDTAGCPAETVSGPALNDSRVRGRVRRVSTTIPQGLPGRFMMSLDGATFAALHLAAVRTTSSIDRNRAALGGDRAERPIANRPSPG